MRHTSPQIALFRADVFAGAEKRSKAGRTSSMPARHIGGGTRSVNSGRNASSIRDPETPFIRPMEPSLSKEFYSSLSFPYPSPPVGVCVGHFWLGPHVGRESW